MKSNLPGIGLSALLLAACASAPGSAVELSGTRWHLVSAEQGTLAKLASRSSVTLDFSADRISGYGGCNTYSAGYTLNSAQLTVATVSATKRSCTDDANEVERAWFATLSSPLTVMQDTNGLQLRAAEGGTLRFASGPAPTKP